MDRTVQNNTSQEKRRLESLKRFIPYTEFMERHDLYSADFINYDDQTFLKKSFERYYIEQLSRQHDEEKAAKSMEAPEIKLQAAIESEKKMASKNKADSDDNDNNESKKGDFIKNNSDSDVTDDDKQCVATANNKRGNNDTVDGDKEKNDEEDYTKGKETS